MPTGLERTVTGEHARTLPVAAIGRRPLLPSSARNARPVPRSPRVVRLVVLTHNWPGDGRRRGPVPWRPFPMRPAGSAAEPPVRVSVDGEEFEIAASPDRPTAGLLGVSEGPGHG